MGCLLFPLNMPEKVSSFLEARKKSAREKALEVLDLEPLASVEPKEKGVMCSMKQKMEYSIPLEDGRRYAKYKNIAKASWIEGTKHCREQ